jgi:formyl-CoA transferase
MSVTVYCYDLHGCEPQKPGIAISDLMTGMYACTAILAAVAHRESSGAGQYIDTCLFDTQVAMMAVMNMNYLVSGTPPGRAGNAHQNIVPYQVFACADGHLILAVGNDAQFARFCDVAGKTEWARDRRFAANAERVKRRDVLVPMIAAVMETRKQRNWLDALDAVGVPCGPINRLDQVFADPQVHARGLRFDLPHRLSESVPQVGNPLHFSATPVAYTQAPPLLGEHTATVLSLQLGLSAASLADLAARGVIEVGK